MLGIVIPAYKRRDCLREALQSLCCQTYKKFFVIVVDDHSPEPLKDVVEEFDNKLHIGYRYAEKNGGPGAARQIGLETCYESNFDLVMFMDSDDMLYPHAVARLVYEINHSMADVVSSAIWAEDKNGTGTLLDATNKTWLHGKIFRTMFLKNNNLVFPPIRTNEDLAFNLMVIETARKASYISEPLYLFRYAPESITRTGNSFMSILSIDYIRAIYYADKYISERMKENIQLNINIFVIYNYYQTGVSMGLEIDDEIREMISELLNKPVIQTILRTPSLLQEYTHLINNFMVFNKKVYFFQQTFYDWVKEFTDENNNN